MKNNNVTSLWNEYKNELNDAFKNKMPKIEKAIEKFEDEGYQIETMSRSESKKLSLYISDGVSYTTAVNYCCVLNKFLKIYEQKHNTKCEKVYAQNLNNDYYHSEDELIDDMESFINEALKEILYHKSLNNYQIESFKDSYLSSVCMIILRWYGMTFEEIRMIKLDDINGNIIKLKNREKSLSDRASKYINRYKEMTKVTHFWKGLVEHDLPESGYLFRRESIKVSDESYEPMTLNMMAVYQSRFIKTSKIKKNVLLSGAFDSIPEKITEPKDFLERIRNYIGDEKISDINIKKCWVNYLESME